MQKLSYEKVHCPKCGREYAVPKGSAKAFPCAGRDCQETVNPSKTKEAKRENI